MNKVISILLLGTGVFLSGPQARAQCDCSALFDQVVEKLEANYIGLKHQSEERLQAYVQRKAAYSERVGVLEGTQCVQELDEFLGFFQDGHLSVSEYPAASDTVKTWIKENKRSPEEVLDVLARQLKTDLRGDNRIIGKYHDGQSELAIIAVEGEYRAYLISSEKEGAEPGELKVAIRPTEKGYRGIYYSYTYAARYTKSDLYKSGALLSIGGTLWAKTDSGLQQELAAVDLKKGINKPTIQKVGDKSALITIPSFLVQYKELADLTKQHNELLLESENLIFDIRGNTGGNAIYFSLFPYFADRTMPGGQGQVLASADNQAYFERNLQYSKKIYGPVVEAIKASMGAVVDGPAYRERTVKRKKGSRVKNVAILSDEGCMSAAESFILHARGISSLVKTFGSPTRGVIDYTSVNGIKLDCEGNNIYFGYPTSTLHMNIPENGYNKTGMIPHVPIGPNVKDKVQYIIDYFNAKDK